MHQCARFYSNLSKDHTNNVEYITRYLKGTSSLGISFKPEISKIFKCFADADYCGNWYRSFYEMDPSTAKSCTDWIITYAS